MSKIRKNKAEIEPTQHNLTVKRKKKKKKVVLKAKGRLEEKIAFKGRFSLRSEMVGNRERE